MSHRLRGFSLVEIVIALAVISFALVAIIGMFPVAMNAARDSRNETRAATIAQLIVGQLRTFDSSQTTAPAGPDVSLGRNSGFQPATSRGTTTNYCYTVFDDDGKPLSLATGAQYTGGTYVNPSVTAKAAFASQLAIAPNTPVDGVCRVDVTISYPATAPLTARKNYVFTTLLSN